MTTVILSHGTIEDFAFHREIIERSNYLICADGGALYASRMGVRPNVILGDFDSMDAGSLKNFSKSEIITFPREKDKTDTELAVDYAASLGEKHVILLGATGTRLDHTLANIFLLKSMMDRGMRGEVINENNRMFLISDKGIVKGKDTTVSLIPFGVRVTGITLSGFKFPLEDETLEIGSSRGISNELTDETGEIRIKGGLLLVVQAKD